MKVLFGLLVAAFLFFVVLRLMARAQRNVGSLHGEGGSSSGIDGGASGEGSD